MCPAPAVAVLLGVGLMLCFSSSYTHAQTPGSPPTTSSKAQRLQWPRTFSGQPDFMFSRDEALTEARTSATRQGSAMPLTPMLQQLIYDDSALDPLLLNAPQPEILTITDVSGTITTTEVSSTAQQGQSLMERLMAQSLDLPSVSATTQPDFTEFKTRLNATIDQTVAGWQPQAGAYNFEPALSTLVLQAVVTSPVKYAVINQQKYTEGETFRLSVPLAVPDEIIISAMQGQMPASGTLPAQLQSSYEDSYRDTLGNFYARRNQTPEIGRQTLILPVRVIAITPRQVLLDMGGKPYALTIRYAY